MRYRNVFVGILVVMCLSNTVEAANVTSAVLRLRARVEARKIQRLHPTVTKITTVIPRTPKLLPPPAPKAKTVFTNTGAIITDGIKQINDARIAANAKALTVQPLLNKAAEIIARKIDETGDLKLAADNLYVSGVLRQAGYFPTNDEKLCQIISFRGIQLVGRNTSPNPQIVNDWLNITQYRSYLLNSAYTEMGLAKVGTVWLVLLQQKVATDKAGANTSDQSNIQQKILQLVNSERVARGLPILSINPIAQAAAQSYAEEMQKNGFYDHIAPDGRNVLDRMIAAGLPVSSSRHGAFGENIAKGQQSAEEVMKGWMDSEGHRENILSSAYREIGIGVYCNFWVQDFLGPQP